MEKIIAVIDSSLRFTMSFCAYINERRVLPHHVMGFTNWTEYDKCRKEYDTKLVLIADEFREEAGEELSDCPVIWLSDKPTDPEENILNRYQEAEHIARAMIGRLNGLREMNPQHSLCRLTIVYAPAGGVGKTSCALAYAAYSGKTRRVLYLNLEEYAACTSLFGSAEYTFTDALSCFLENPGECRERIMSCIYHARDFDYIAPTGCPSEWEELDFAMLDEFLRLLRSDNLFDEIVLDCGSIVKQQWALLNLCDCILVPEIRNHAVCREKYDSFEQYIEKGRYPHLRDRIRSVVIPYHSEWAGQALSWERLCSSEYAHAMKEAGL